MVTISIARAASASSPASFGVTPYNIPRISRISAAEIEAPIAIPVMVIAHAWPRTERNMRSRVAPRAIRIAMSRLVRATVCESRA